MLRRVLGVPNKASKESPMRMTPSPSQPTSEIVDPAGRTVHEADAVTLSEFGGYSGEYTIPETAAVGWYQFKLTAGFSARRIVLVGLRRVARAARAAR